MPDMGALRSGGQSWARRTWCAVRTQPFGRSLKITLFRAEQLGFLAKPWSMDEPWLACQGWRALICRNASSRFAFCPHGDAAPGVGHERGAGLVAVPRSRLRDPGWCALAREGAVGRDGGDAAGAGRRARAWITACLGPRYRFDRSCLGSMGVHGADADDVAARGSALHRSGRPEIHRSGVERRCQCLVEPRPRGSQVRATRPGARSCGSDAVRLGTRR